jgi:hypothetical protein
MVPSPPLSLVAIERLLADDLLNKGRHPHAFRNQTCSGKMHDREKFAAGAVNAGDLSHVNFDLLAGARGRAPNTFGFINPGAAKFAGEFQPTLRAILMKHDS